jgi:hypothetical protein
MWPLLSNALSEVRITIDCQRQRTYRLAKPTMIRARLPNHAGGRR